MMPLEYFPLIPAGVRVSEVRAAARSQTSLGQRQLSVLSEFLLSAKIVRNGASSIRLARRVPGLACRLSPGLTQWSHHQRQNLVRMPLGKVEKRFRILRGY